MPEVNETEEQTTEFSPNHYLSVERWNSFQNSFRDESIQLEICHQRDGPKGTEVCGKAKCLACQDFSSKNGIQINIGFSGHGSIVRNEFRDQMRKHRQTKKHIKALQIWREKNGLPKIDLQKMPEPAKRSSPRHAQTKRAKSERISKKKEKKLSEQKNIGNNVVEANNEKKEAQNMKKIQQQNLRNTPYHGIFWNEEKRSWISGKSLETFKTELGAASKVDEKIVEKNPRWFEEIHPRHINFIERYKFLPKEYQSIMVRNSFVDSLNGEYTCDGIFKKKFSCYKKGNCRIFFRNGLWYMSCNGLETPRALHFADNEVPIPIDCEWKDIYGRKSEVTVELVIRDSGILMVPNCSYACENEIDINVNLKEKFAIEEQFKAYTTQEGITKKTHMIQDIRVTIPDGIFLFDHKQKPATEKKEGTCLFLEMKIGGKYLVLSNKLRPLYHNWLFLVKSYLTIVERMDYITNYLDKMFSGNDFPFYLTLSQIISVDSPNCLTWEQETGLGQEKYLDKILDVWFDKGNLLWWYFIQFEGHCKEESEWMIWEDAKTKHIQKNIDALEVQISQLYKFYDKDSNAVRSHFDCSQTELELTRDREADQEILKMIQGFDENKKENTEDKNKSQWNSMMQNTELFWSYWFDDREILCMIVRAILTLDKGEGVKGDEVCSWLSARYDKISVESVGQVLNRAILCGILIFAEKNQNLKVDKEKGILLQKCFPGLLSMTNEEEEKNEIENSGQYIGNDDSEEKDNDIEMGEKEAADSVMEISSALTQNKNQSRKRPIGETPERPRKRQKLNGKHASEWCGWKDTVVCLMMSFNLPHLHACIDKSLDEIKHRWHRILNENIDIQNNFNGVIWDDQEKKFLSKITYNGISYIFGHFDNPLDAAQCSDEVLMRYGHRTLNIDGFISLKWLNFPHNKEAFITIPSLATSHLYVSLTGKIDKPWRTDLLHEGKNLFVGEFETEVQAAIAGDQKATELIGKFANLNYFDQQPTAELQNSKKNMGPLRAGQIKLHDFPRCKYDEAKECFTGEPVVGTAESVADYVKKLKELKGENWLPVKPELFMFRGVTWDEITKSWNTTIFHPKEQKHMCIGSYKNLLEASLAYDKKAAEFEIAPSEINYMSGHPHVASHMLNTLQIPEENKSSSIANTIQPRKRKNLNANELTEKLILETGMSRLGYKEGDVVEWSLLLNSLVVLIGLFYHKTTSHDYFSRYQQLWEGVLYKFHGTNVIFIKTPQEIRLGKLHESVMNKFLQCGNEGVMEDLQKWEQFWIDLKATKLSRPPAMEQDPEKLNLDISQLLFENRYGVYRS